VCGDGACTGDETSATCCVDCSCDDGLVCTGDKCAPVCGDGLCAPGESPSTCCGDCACPDAQVCGASGACAALGGWFFLTTTLAPEPRSVRGEATFSADGNLTLTSWVDSAGAMGGGGVSDKFTFSLSSDLAITIDGKVPAKGQLTTTADLMVTTSLSNSGQTLWVRKSKGLSVAKLGGASYRMVGLRGIQLMSPLYVGFEGTFILDAAGCLLPGSITRSSFGGSTTPSEGCFQVMPDGSTSISYSEGGNATKLTGWAGLDGQIVVMSPEVPMGGTPLAGAHVFLRQPTLAETPTDLEGTFSSAGLFADMPMARFEAVINTATTSASGLLSGSFQSSLAMGATKLAPGSSYQLGKKGALALDLQGVTGISHLQAGQAAPMSAGGRTQVLLTFAATSFDTGAVSEAGSLALWIRRRDP
jgi:hypothetical protein